MVDDTIRTIVSNGREVDLPRLNLRPGNAVVARVRGRSTDVELDAVGRYLRAVFDGTGVRVAVVDEDVELAEFAPDDAARAAYDAYGESLTWAELSESEREAWAAVARAVLRLAREGADIWIGKVD